MAGTRKKVYTNKLEFDKANKAYNDSLKLYNTTPWEAKNFMSIPNTNQSDWFDQFAKDKIKPVGIHNDSDGIPLYKKSTTQPVFQKAEKKIEPYKPKSQADFDYRNKMYNDSLDSYNFNKESLNKLYKTKKTSKGTEVDLSTKKYVNRQQGINEDFLKYQKLGLNISKKDVEKEWDSVDKNIKSVGAYKFNLSNGSEYTLKQYKKPVQQILPYTESTDNKMVNDFNKGTGAIIQKAKPLSEEEQYQTWRSNLPKNLQYEGDYDLRGFWKENPNFEVKTKDDHLTDKFKLPNHETFSNESKYYKPGMKAVKWVNDQPVPIQTQKYSAAKYLELKGKPSGYVNEGNNQGRVELKADGGWLDELPATVKDTAAYNNMYNSPENLGRTGFMNEKEYLNNWFASDRFKNKIGTANPGSTSSNAVNKVSTSKVFYNPNNTQKSINDYVDVHTEGTSKDKKNLTKGKSVGLSYKNSNDALVTKREGQNNPNSIAVHELTHLTNLDEVTKDKFKSTLYQDKYGNTVPFNRGEAYPSLMQFRYDNKFKPDQVITPKDMENIRNSGYRNILYDKYSDEDIMNYLNTVADNSKTNPNQMAKGGTLNLPGIPKSQQEAEAMIASGQLKLTDPNQHYTPRFPKYNPNKPLARGNVEESISPLDFINVGKIGTAGVNSLMRGVVKPQTPKVIMDAVEGINPNVWRLKDIINKADKGSLYARPAVIKETPNKFLNTVDDFGQMLPDKVRMKKQGGWLDNLK